VGVSVAPIEIEFQTWTNKSGVEKGKDRGMAPMAFRVVKHGLYAVPFFVNPTQARKTGCTKADVDLMLHLLKYAYSHTRSVIRTQVEILHAHAVQHKDPLGSFSDFALLDALTPKRVPNADKPSEQLTPDYEVPTWEGIENQVVRKGKNTKWNEVGDYKDYAL
jgi:CRISPR/Cas system type I-B associated protein Csh2 (Cas7 group RAMP superfamily)